MMDSIELTQELAELTEVVRQLSHATAVLLQRIEALERATRKYEADRVTTTVPPVFYTEV